MDFFDLPGRFDAGYGDKKQKRHWGEVYVPSIEQREELRIGNIRKYLNMSFSSETEEIQFLFLRERITAIVDSFGRKKTDVKITGFQEAERKRGKAMVKLKEGEREIAVFDEEGKERVLCKVNCTEFGFLNWVMQYTDFALVLQLNYSRTECVLTWKQKRQAERPLQIRNVILVGVVPKRLL